SGLDLIVFDRTAAGHGWYVDPTPLDDRKFGTVVSASLRYTNRFSTPAGHVDLLTAVMHEMGHRLGIPNPSSSADRGSLMYLALSVGERRLPAKSDSASAQRGSALDAGAQSDGARQDVLKAVAGENPDKEQARQQGNLSQSELNWMAQAAIARWQAAGISAE